MFFFLSTTHLNPSRQNRNERFFSFLPAVLRKDNDYCYRCVRISPLTWTLKVLYCKRYFDILCETQDVFSPRSINLFKFSNWVEGLQKTKERHLKIFTKRSIGWRLLHQLWSWKSDHEALSSWTSSPAPSAATASTHRPSSETAVGSKRVAVSDAACDHSPWLRAAAQTCLRCSCQCIPPPQASILSGGSTLCQPWSGMYYRSCWSDGF